MHTAGHHNADKNMSMTVRPPPPQPPLQPDDDEDDTDFNADDQDRTAPATTTPATAPRDEVVRRQWRIRQDDLKQHGYTPDCKGCKRVQRGLRTRGGTKSHSLTCRARLESRRIQMQGAMSGTSSAM